jgi:hypothetical protein
MDGNGRYSHAAEEAPLERDLHEAHQTLKASSGGLSPQLAVTRRRNWGPVWSSPKGLLGLSVQRLLIRPIHAELPVTTGLQARRRSATHNYPTTPKKGPLHNHHCQHTRSGRSRTEQEVPLIHKLPIRHILCNLEPLLVIKRDQGGLLVDVLVRTPPMCLC